MKAERTPQVRLLRNCSFDAGDPPTNLAVNQDVAFIRQCGTSVEWQIDWDKPKFHLARHVSMRHVWRVECVETSVSSRVILKARHGQNAWARYVERWRDEPSGISALFGASLAGIDAESPVMRPITSCRNLKTCCAKLCYCVCLCDFVYAIFGVIMRMMTMHSNTLCFICTRVCICASRRQNLAQKLVAVPQLHYR